MLTGRSYGGTPVMSSPSMNIFPEVGVSNPPSMRSSVVLPQPEAPKQAEYFALVDFQADIVDRLEVAEGFADALDLHVGTCGRIVPGLPL